MWDCVLWFKSVTLTPWSQRSSPSPAAPLIANTLRCRFRNGAAMSEIPIGNQSSLRGIGYPRCRLVEIKPQFQKWHGSCWVLLTFSSGLLNWNLNIYPNYLVASSSIWSTFWTRNLKKKRSQGHRMHSRRLSPSVSPQEKECPNNHKKLILFLLSFASMSRAVNNSPLMVLLTTVERQQSSPLLLTNNKEQTVLGLLLFCCYKSMFTIGCKVASKSWEIHLCLGDGRSNY